MLQPKPILSANDNAPLRPTRIRFGTQTAQKTTPTKPSNQITSYKRKSLFAWLLPLLVCAMAGYALWAALPLHNLIWPAAIAGALLFWSAARAERHSRFRNISTLLLIAATAVGLAGLFALNGFTLIGVELALLVSALSLFAGWVLKSRPAIMLSVFATLGYLASLFPEFGLLTGLAEERSQLGMGLMPFLLIGQTILAQRLRSSALIMIVLTASYIWLFAIAKNMPLPALTGLGFALTAAHYCLGKAWADRHAFGARLHSFFALCLALAASLYIQSLWMSTGSGQATPFWPPSTLWWAILGVAMFALFVSSLMRYKTSHISLTGIFIICLAVVILPLATAKPDLIYSAFDFIPGLEARPGMGLIIGAVIVACGVNWIVTGLKNGHFSNVAIGAAAIGLEGLILYKPDQFNVDVGVVLIVSLICALCIGGLITGSTADQSRNSPYYA